MLTDERLKEIEDFIKRWPGTVTSMLTAEVEAMATELQRRRKGMPKRKDDGDGCQCEICSAMRASWNECVEAMERALQE